MTRVRRRHSEIDEATHIVRTFERAGVYAPYFMALESGFYPCNGPSVGSYTIRAAQKAIVNGFSVFQGADYDQLGCYYKRDGIHPNDAGRHLFAQMWQQVIDRYIDLNPTLH